jgi:hypothetical protein
MSDRPDWFAQLQGRYRVEREIGRGGMAQVYLAEELQHRRPVAIKVLPEGLASAIGQDRFLREVEVAARLNHPNILPLLDSGTIPADIGRPALPYFVMPYIEGESLKQRLARGPLALREALDVIRAVASALDHAHASGIVHRDVKPANILLTGGTAVVTDFGIARAIDESVAAATLTGTGIIIGTPQYMSPEQGAAGEAVDARTDVYALGCVAYEMLAGTPPFVADSALTLLARHRLDPPPSLTTARPDLPPGVAAAVRRALAKIPAERFASAGAFADALRDVTDFSSDYTAPTPRPSRSRPWAVATLVGGAALVIALGIGARVRGHREGTAGAATDTTRFAILPVEQMDSGRRAVIGGLLRDAFARWNGISVADWFQIKDHLERRHRAVPANNADAQAVAEALGAGRMVRSTVSPIGGKLRISATLYDTRSQAPLTWASVMLDSSFADAQAALELLADSLLLRQSAPDGGPSALPDRAGDYGTRSRPALLTFSEGQGALQGWDLARADSAFGRAMAADGQFARAALWLALVRSWAGRPVADWSSAAQQAWSGRERLFPAERAMAATLTSRAAGEMAASCQRWDSLAHAPSPSFVAWYGLGDCLATDRTVVRDAASPSGWRFRTSYHAALSAYQHAYLLVPSILLALRDGDFQSVRGLYMTSLQDSRFGVARDGTHFLAMPSWRADTLALVPWPVDGAAGAAEPPPTNTGDALANQRQLYYRTVSAWADAFPDNPDALAALAQAREMVGDQTAADALRQARRLATTPDDQLLFAIDAVHLQLKQSFPGDTAGLARAGRLADSLLDADPATNASGHLKLAGIAALTGRIGDARRHLQRPGVGELFNPPPGIAQSGPALELLAALGRPADSIAELEHAVRDIIDTQLPDGDRGSARLRWLARPVTLAYPDYVSPLLGALRGQGDFFLDAIASLVAGDTAGALNPLDKWAAWRRASGVGAVTLDQLPALASTYDLAGRQQDAVALLDSTLLHLFGSGPDALGDPVNAASLGRAVALRTELAAKAGDTAATRRWAGALAILWRNADSAFRNMTRRLTQLAGVTPRDTAVDRVHRRQ